MVDYHWKRIAKIYILKYRAILENDVNVVTVLFTGNNAEYGGAVYVNDYTNSGMCGSDLKIECFLQVLAIYHDDIPGG